MYAQYARRGQFCGFSHPPVEEVLEIGTALSAPEPPPLEETGQSQDLGVTSKR